MFDIDEFMSYDYMTGFLMGRALYSKPDAEQEPECCISVPSEEYPSANSMLLRDMNKKMIQYYIDTHMPKDLP